MPKITKRDKDGFVKAVSDGQFTVEAVKAASTHVCDYFKCPHGGQIPTGAIYAKVTNRGTPSKQVNGRQVWDAKRYHYGCVPEGALTALLVIAGDEPVKRLDPMTVVVDGFRIREMTKEQEQRVRDLSPSKRAEFVEVMREKRDEKMAHQFGQIISAANPAMRQMGESMNKVAEAMTEWATARAANSAELRKALAENFPQAQARAGGIQFGDPADWDRAVERVRRRQMNTD